MGAGTSLTGMENYPVCLILSTNGPAALKVNWVHVWQTGGTTGTGGTGTTTGTITQTVSSFPSTLSLSTTQSPYALPATTSAGLVLTYSVASGPATVSGDALTLTGAGTVVLNASQAGNSTYAPYSGAETITVSTPSTQTVSGFPSTLNLSTTQSPYSLPASTSAGLSITYSVSSGPATVSGHALTLTGAGYRRAQGDSGRQQHLLALFCHRDDHRHDARHAVALQLPSTLALTMAQSPYTLQATTTAGLTVKYAVASGPSHHCRQYAHADRRGHGCPQRQPGGQLVFRGLLRHGNDLRQHAAADRCQPPGALSLSTTQSPHTLPAKTDQGLALTYAVKSGSGTLSGNVLSFSSASTIALTATQAGNATYSSWSENVTVTVTAPAAKNRANRQQLPVDAEPDHGQTPYTLPATTSAGLTLSYSVVSGPATVSGNVLTLTGSGVVVVTGAQAGNSTYAAYSGNEAITVTAVAQTLTGFPSTLSLTTGQSPYTLPATTSAGLTVTYSVSSGPATISGHSLTLTGAGTVVVAASQAGNATYSAFSASETIAVSALTAQTVANFPSTQSVTLGSGAISLTAKTSAGQSITYTVVSGPATISGDTLTITGSGTVVISASAGGSSTVAAFSGTETITVTSGNTMTFAVWEAQARLLHLHADGQRFHLRPDRHAGK